MNGPPFRYDPTCTCDSCLAQRTAREKWLDDACRKGRLCPRCMRHVHNCVCNANVHCTGKPADPADSTYVKELLNTT